LACRTIRRADPQLAAAMRAIGQLRLTVEPPASTFEALAKAIVYQQLTGKAAATIYRRLAGAFPGRRGLDASAIAAADDGDLRAVGLSRSKAASLRDLATRAAARQLPSVSQLAAMDDE